MFQTTLRVLMGRFLLGSGDYMEIYVDWFVVDFMFFIYVKIYCEVMLNV